MLIIIGIFGCILITSPGLFLVGVEQTELNERSLTEEGDYPFYYLGVILAVAFTVVNALKFLAMSELGNAVHSSVKTLWFGIFSTIIVLTFMIFYEPSFYALWRIGTDSYPITGS